ncbi:unnamed protein product [Rhizoctonia solani]|uniref:Uncharacterized protein n=1 Tax=Rhizoctonia solani TaxID=456999 RepID=A0A8H3AEY9_9AGAM|nr:unnamed protein product [Rhizoctonia solani]
MPSTRQRTTFRKRNLRNGALLAVSEAAKLVNIPLAQDVARHIKQVAVALKSSVLQAPKTNDLNARDLAKHIEGLLGVLNTALQHLQNSGLPKAGDHDDILVELGQLHTHLSDTHTKLQELQKFSYTTKLASQTEFRERILELKEELSRTIVNLTLRLLVLVLASGAQHQLVMQRRLNSSTREHNALSRDHNALMRKHNALVRVSQRRQRISDNHIRGLRRDCEGLTRQVNAVLFMRRTDEQRISDLVRLNGALFFFRSSIWVRGTLWVEYEPRVH